MRERIAKTPENYAKHRGSRLALFFCTAAGGDDFVNNEQGIKNNFFFKPIEHVISCGS